MKKALFIGGTGTISAAIVRRLVNELGWEVWLLNRGNRPEAVPEGAQVIVHRDVPSPWMMTGLPSSMRLITCQLPFLPCTPRGTLRSS